MVSPDLTRNDPEKLKPSGGPITRDNTGAEIYCTIFALAESPHQPGLFWAGSRTMGWSTSREDGGAHLAEHHPARSAGVVADRDHRAVAPRRGTAYLAATRYKHDDTRPYLYKTTDCGSTWTPINGNLPIDEFTRVIREDPHQPGLLYAGTETGIYVSLDDGGRWRAAGGNLPVVPIHDLVVKGDELVVATHGRSFWILDDLDAAAPAQPATRRGAAAPLRSRSRRVRTRLVRRPSDEPTPMALTHYVGSNQHDSYLPETKRPDGDRARACSTPGRTRRRRGHPLLPARGAGGRRPAQHPRRRRDGDPAPTFTPMIPMTGLPAQAGLNRFLWNLRCPARRT